MFANFKPNIDNSLNSFGYSNNDENQFIPDTEPILLKKYNFASGALSLTGLPFPFDLSRFYGQFGDLSAQFRDFSFMAIESNGFIYTTDCTDWSKKAEKKNNWIDNLGVQIYSSEYEDFLRNEAY